MTEKTITSLPGIAPPQNEFERKKPFLPRQNGMAAEIVDVGEAVVYHDLGSGRSRRVRVVTPEKADPARGWISAGSPVGAALIGLREGQFAHWQDRGGKKRTLRVLRIENQLEPVGYLNV